MDQRLIERRDDVLVYTSAPLEHDLELTGPLELVLYAASSARDTDFTVKLVDVFPNGYAMNLSEGIIRARYRHDDAKPELLERGDPQRCTPPATSSSAATASGWTSPAAASRASAAT